MRNFSQIIEKLEPYHIATADLRRQLFKISTLRHTLKDLALPDQTRQTKLATALNLFTYGLALKHVLLDTAFQDLTKLTKQTTALLASRKNFPNCLKRRYLTIKPDLTTDANF